MYGSFSSSLVKRLLLVQNFDRTFSVIRSSYSTSRQNQDNHHGSVIHYNSQFTIYSFVTPQPILDMRWICARRLSYTLRCKTR